ncbi:MAG: hypothetical protein DRP97_03605 [Candidatus Latescibacterota bacterium]|nr:MAG: hypothetical protein DRP97_03605 [Candidatus Latescibacterota bacterium]
MTKIKRFDETEFDILKHASPRGYGYYLDDLHRERAEILMADGILENIPPENWHIAGWKLTKKGLKYYDDFIAAVRTAHGHEWKTYRDSYPEDYADDDKDGDEIDIFAYSAGRHNGMVCKKCGFSFCHHCQTEFSLIKNDKCTR